MKKFLSLVLALVMTMSLVTVAGAKDFADADSINYDEAVEVMTALEVVGGYADGSFNPKGTLTRGAAAKIICNLLVGPETAASLVANTAPFSDVPADHTFAGYIAYCVNEGIISGYADGTFKPANTLTGYAFMKMLLGVVGYNSDVYTGTNWAINVAQDVVKAELAKGLDGKFNGNKALTREEACLFALNALNAHPASFTPGTKVIVGGVEVVTGGGDVVVNEKAQVRDELFPDLKLYDGKDYVDSLSRPAHEWKLKVDKKWESIGVYTDTPVLTYVGKIEKAETVEDDLEAAGFVDYENLTMATVATNIQKAAKIGAVIEVFENADGNYATFVQTETVKDTVAKKGIVADMKSTKDKDERAIVFESGLKIAAVKEDVKNSVEVENFEELYAALEAEDYVLIVKQAAGDDKGKVYSVEIPEVVEAKITKINKDKDQIVADGKTYDVAAGTLALGNAEIVVGADGVAYFVKAAETAESDAIYLDKVFEAEKDKWGNYTVKAQIVDENNEIKEVELAYSVEVSGKDVTVNYSKAAGKFYTYEVEDGVYTLKNTNGKLVAESLSQIKKDIEDDDVRADGEYFADGVEFVYIAKTGKDLKVTVKTGVQNVVVLDKDSKVVTNVFYVMDADAEYITRVYVMAAADEKSDDVLFYTGDDVLGDVYDNEGEKAVLYKVYADGEKKEIMISKAPSAGFYTYTIDADSGVYTLEAVTKDTYTGEAYANEGKGVWVEEDKYVFYKSAIEEATLSADAEIYDLTEEGLVSLAAIADWDGTGKDALKLSFQYDAKENEITVIYVEFVGEAE